MKDEPSKAAAFWDREISPLPAKHGEEVETLLPTINSL